MPSPGGPGTGRQEGPQLVMGSVPPPELWRQEAEGDTWPSQALAPGTDPVMQRRGLSGLLPCVHPHFWNPDPASSREGSSGTQRQAHITPPSLRDWAPWRTHSVPPGPRPSHQHLLPLHTAQHRATSPTSQGAQCSPAIPMAAALSELGC